MKEVGPRLSNIYISEIVEDFKYALDKIPCPTNAAELEEARNKWGGLLLHGICTWEYEEGAISDSLLHDTMSLIACCKDRGCVDRGIDKAIRFLTGKYFTKDFIYNLVIRNLWFLQSFKQKNTNGVDRFNSVTYYYEVIVVLAFGIFVDNWLNTHPNYGIEHRDFQSIPTIKAIKE